MIFKKDKQVDELDDPKIYKRAFQFIKIGNKAVHEAQETNRKLGIPSVYSRKGKIYFELPDGTITHESPWESFNIGKNKK